MMFMKKKYCLVYLTYNTTIKSIFHHFGTGSIETHKITFLEGESPTLTRTSFLPTTSTNVGISPHNFLTFSYNPFITLVSNFKVIPSASPKLLNLNQDHPSKNLVFQVKSL